MAREVDYRLEPQVLGIDPSLTLADFNGRPTYLPIGASRSPSWFEPPSRNGNSFPGLLTCRARLAWRNGNVSSYITRTP